MTHTYALLDISADAFVEIWGKLEAAGYSAQFHDEGDTFVIDMHGLALRAEESGSEDPVSPEATDVLPEHVLERIAWYAKQASATPVHVIQMPEDADPAQWCKEALLKTVGQTVYGVSVGTREEITTRGALLTAITGNGSESHANANFYMLCHTAVPMLVAEIRRLRVDKETTR
jgi:hypothetical protein